MSFKDNLRNECEYQDIQYKELAAKIDIPYTTLLSYVNNRECLPNIEISYKIAKTLNVSMEYLLTGKDFNENKVKYSTTYNELMSLPEPLLSSFVTIIHNMYELYKGAKLKHV